ncbi:MAG: hypothetical protein ABDK94_06210 [Atribacterota bacterium]
MIGKWVVHGILAMVFGCGIIVVGNQVDARKVWREMTTPHFRVIFPETL